jgi:ferredoxin-NADP reductase
VAVLHERHGRGGSREIHETRLVGRTVGVRGPRNHFKLREADEYLLIAGGIGVTPLLAMARHLDAEGYPWRLVYGGRSRASMAFLTELSAFGGAVTVVPQDEQGLPDLDAILDDASPGTEVYCCGPEGLLRAVEAAGSARGIPVHVERFGTAGPAGTSAAATAPVVAAAADEKPAAAGAEAAVAEPDVGTFQVELRRTGITVEVDPDRTILEAVREHLPEVISSCEEGFCGACETRVIEGVPDHRDQVLDPIERESNETMMICVGRSCTKRLVLDL